MATLTTEQWIKKAIERCGDRYDYSLSNYTGSKSKIKITCKIHGQFETVAEKHISKDEKRGHCQKCLKVKKLKLNNDKFIKKAILKHGDKYTYDNVVYANSATKVSITCKKHGDFLQTPGDHIFGYGCPYCAGTKKSTTSEFIKKSRKIHGNKYDYSIVKYNGNKRPVEIICPIHGEFIQAPSDHLSGKGCKKCSEPKLKNGLTRYDTYYERLESVGVKCRRSTNNYDVLQVKCYGCKKWHDANYNAVYLKARAIDGTVNANSQNNIYCSDRCKHSCPVFGFNSSNVDPRSKLYIEKTESQKARSCQTDHLKQLQCGEYGYNYCERCGDIIDVELHHTLPISKYGMKAVSSAGHILLCAGCHTKIHGECE